MANNEWNVKIHADFDINFHTAKMCIAMLNIYLADNPGKRIKMYIDEPKDRAKFQQIDIHDFDNSEEEYE